MKKILAALLVTVSVGAFAANEVSGVTQQDRSHTLFRSLCDNNSKHTENYSSNASSGVYTGRLLLAQRDVGQCMGACASEQGICIGQCQGNGQCISNCAAAHGRCVARCN